MAVRIFHRVGGRVRVNSMAFTYRLMNLPAHRQASFAARVARHVQSHGWSF